MPGLHGDQDGAERDRQDRRQNRCRSYQIVVRE